MAYISEKLREPVSVRLDFTRHFISLDCSFPFYLVVNPTRPDCLEGTDVGLVPTGGFEIDAWTLLSKDYFPNNPGFIAVLVYDKALVNDSEGFNAPVLHYHDVDFGKVVSGHNGQSVNITGFDMATSMPVTISTPDKKPLTVSNVEVSYSADILLGSRESLAGLQGFSRKLSAEEVKVLGLIDEQDFDYVDDVQAYDLELCRASLTAYEKGNESRFLKLFPSGVCASQLAAGEVQFPFVPSRAVMSWCPDFENVRLLDVSLKNKTVEKDNYYSFRSKWGKFENRHDFYVQLGYEVMTHCNWHKSRAFSFIVNDCDSSIVSKVRGKLVNLVFPLANGQPCFIDNHSTDTRIAVTFFAMNQSTGDKTSRQIINSEVFAFEGDSYAPAPTKPQEGFFAIVGECVMDLVSATECDLGNLEETLLVDKFPVVIGTDAEKGPYKEAYKSFLVDVIYDRFFGDDKMKELEKSVADIQQKLESAKVPSLGSFTVFGTRSNTNFKENPKAVLMKEVVKNPVFFGEVK